jgi:hypothetical protein
MVVDAKVEKGDDVFMAVMEEEEDIVAEEEGGDDFVPIIMAATSIGILDIEVETTTTMNKAPSGSHVWEAANPEILKRMHRLAELDPPKSPAKVAVEGRVCTPLTVCIIDERTGLVGVVNSL